jgi:hypothetical protein
MIVLRRLQLGVCVASLAFATVAHAQPTDADGDGTETTPGNQANPDATPGLSDTSPSYVPTLLAPVSIVEGPGIKVGEGTVVHAIVGADVGFISNVFYEDESDARRGRGIMRLIAQAGTGSLPGSRLGGTKNPGLLQYRADLRATYDIYLSGNDAIQDQNGLGLNGVLRGVIGPRRPFSLLFFDNYERLIRAPNFETSSSVNRNINRLALGLQWAPTGRSVKGLLRYENYLEYFEDDDQSLADRMQHTLGLTGTWRVRPVTQVFLDTSLGFYGGLGSDSVKVDSNPLVVQGGIQTLLSLRTTVVGRIGYQNGFYSSGPSFGTILGSLQLGYRYSPLGRVVGMYEYVHADSVNANYYRDHALKLQVTQQFVPFLVQAEGGFAFRRYQGIQALIPTAEDTRDDVVGMAAASVRYNFRDSIAAVLQYRFTGVFTDYRYTLDGDTDDPSFTRHEVVLGVRFGL